jgi:hypothetical protein
MLDGTAELQKTVRARSRGRMDLLAFAVSPDEHWAVTLLRVHETGYWLESLYEHTADGWIEHMTSNGVLAYTGIGETEDGMPVGVLRYYGEAPTDSEVALVRWGGEVHEVPVQGGYFAFAVWDASERETYEPAVVGFR